MMERVLLVLASTVAACLAQGGDQTVLAGASGVAVVEAALERIASSCVFPDDKLFSRRVAAVESSNGLNDDTYRPGYHGGIWQVDETNFNAIKSGGASLKSSINSRLGIDWSTVTWQDLRKPLYSALAFQLYINSTRADIPRSIENQADFWIKRYRPSGNKASFESTAKTAIQLGNCRGSDIVFVLDGSGSITSSIFRNKILPFVRDVVNAFDIGPDKTRVGLIQFDSSATVEFHLNKYSSKAQILSAVSAVSYQGGGTNIASAIELARKDAFTLANGARPKSKGVPRVAIVLTDGQSSLSQTTQAALKAHAEDIIMFSVGVGSNLDMAELKAVATDPDCQHLFLLSDFSEIDSLRYAIEKRACEATSTLDPTNGNIEGTFDAGVKQNFKIQLAKNGTTISLSTSDGQAALYMSMKVIPNEAQYDRKIVATPGHDGILFIPATGKDVAFASLVTSNENATSMNLKLTPKAGEVDHCDTNKCQNRASCTSYKEDYTCHCAAAYTGKHCETSWGFTCATNNPCTTANVQALKFYHPHVDPKQFIQCDQWGGCFEMPCAPGTVWDQPLLTCIHDTGK